MVYKNLFYRVFFSLFFIIVYFLTSNNQYLLFIFGTLIYLLVFYEAFKFLKNYFLFVLFYLIISYLCFSFYLLIFYDYKIFNILIFTIILFDSYSYLIGKTLGKNLIFKFISPKKTLEGYLGGFLFTNISLISFFYLMSIDINITTFILLVNLTIFFSIIGDLVESYFKRKNNIKDSSNYLPGHGGFFDRFDSFIACIIMLTLFY